MTMISRVFNFIKRELMLVISVLAALISLFITPPSRALIQSIDWRTLGTLFMLLTILEGFKKENIFLPLIQRTTHIKSIIPLTAFFVFSVFFTSMLVTNDVSLIIFVPLTIIVFRSSKKEKYIIPVLTLENIAAIRGSLLTPFGSPQNLYIFTQSGISSKNFVLRMFPLWITSAALLFLFILFIYRKSPKEKITNTFIESKIVPWKPENRKLRITYITLFFIVILAILTRTEYWLIILGLVVTTLLIMDRRILIKTDYVLLLTFLCFFIFSSSISTNIKIAQFLQNKVSGKEYWWSLILSQIVSNVPASIILWPFTTNITALLYGLDTAGLCSIIGSLASVINLRIYTKATPTPGATKNFIKTFQIISLGFFALVVIPQFFLISIFF